MENHIYHFSSPKQNSETIVYHNRAKSTFATSQPSQQSDRILISDLTKDFSRRQNLKSERTPVADLGNIGSLIGEYSRSGSPRDSSENFNRTTSRERSAQIRHLDNEKERRIFDLEEEVRELKHQVKLRDVRIGSLVKENEITQGGRTEFRSLEAQNHQLRSEAEFLRSELKIITKRVQELEEEKNKVLTGRDEISQALNKYTKYIMNHISGMDSNNFAHFCFEERFSSESRLSSLISARDYGTIAVQAFRYISDILPHVAASAPQPLQERNKSPYIALEKNDPKIHASEPSSICYSPIRNDSKDFTPRALVKEMENKGLALQGFEKVHELREASVNKAPLSADVCRGAKNTMKRANTARESKKQTLNLRGGKAETAASILKAAIDRIDSPRSVVKDLNLNQKIKKSSYAQKHFKGEGIENKEKLRLKKDLEALQRAEALANVKKLEEEIERERREAFENEKALLLARKNSIKQKENELNIRDLKEGSQKESMGLADKKGENEEFNGYSSLGVQIKTFNDNQYGRRAKESDKSPENKYKEGIENYSGKKSTVNVKSILKQALGIYDEAERKANEKEKRDEDSRKERLDSSRSKHFASGKEQDQKERFGESAGSHNQSYRQTRFVDENERVFSRNNSKKNLEDEWNRTDKRFKHVEVNLNTGETKDKDVFDSHKPSIRSYNYNYKDSKENLSLSSNDKAPFMNERTSKLNLSHGSFIESASNELSRDSSLCFRVAPQPQPQDKLEDHEDSKIKKEKRENYGTISNKQKANSRQDELIASLEPKTERFVTFDGTDNQHLFTCSDKEPISGDTNKEKQPTSSSTKVSFGKTEGNKLDVRCSPDKKVPSIIDASKKRRTDYSSRDFDILSGATHESSGTAHSRGDYRYLEGAVTSRSRVNYSRSHSGNMKEILSPTIKLHSLETEK